MTKHPTEPSSGEILEKALRLHMASRRDDGASEDRLRNELVGAVALALKSDSARSTSNGDSWLAPLDPRAFHGLAGRFVELVTPESEADPAGLLVQLLVAYGNAAGRHACVRIEDDRHYPNLFALLIGRTALARKGTSWRRVEGVLVRSEPEWANNCIVPGGLSSGEGLIWAVRDEDPDGAHSAARDKRVLVSEGEFAAVLKVLSREGNTLAPVLRNAWDTGRLCIKTKNSPCGATGAHISIVAHITQPELARRLDPTELASGTMNRFLHVAVQRSKYLPEGGLLPQAELDELAHEIKQSVAFARDERELAFEAEASRLWKVAYGILGAERPGQYGDATARGDAQIRRLALVFALLDRSSVIRVVHLWAALAVWDYCDRSAAFVYGDRQADSVADRVLAALKATGTWMARGDLVNELGRHVYGDRLRQAIDALVRSGQVERNPEETGGRPRELLRATKARKPSFLDLCSLYSQPVTPDLRPLPTDRA